VGDKHYKNFENITNIKTVLILKIYECLLKLFKTCTVLENQYFVLEMFLIFFKI